MKDLNTLSLADAIKLAGRYIKRKKGWPKDANLALLNPDGSIGLFYKLTDGNYNDGSPYISLAYRGHCNTWQGTNERNIGEYIKNRLVRISK